MTVKDSRWIIRNLSTKTLHIFQDGKVKCSHAPKNYEQVTVLDWPGRDYSDDGTIHFCGECGTVEQFFKAQAYDWNAMMAQTGEWQRQSHWDLTKSKQGVMLIP